EGEHSGGHAGLGRRLGDRLRHQFAGTRMSIVRLDDDGAASCQSCSGVSTSDGEGEREIAGSEYDHRADRNAALTDVEARSRRTFRLRRIDANTVVIALTDHTGEQTKLPNGTAHLTGEASIGQTRLRHSPLDDLLTIAFDLLSDGVKEGRTIRWSGGAVFAEGLRGRLGCLLDLRGTQLAEFRIKSLVSARINGPDRAFGTRHCPSGNDRHSPECLCHGVLSRWLPGQRCQRLGRMSASRMSASRSARSCGRRSWRGVRTGPASRPIDLRPALTMDTP